MLYLNFHWGKVYFIIFKKYFANLLAPTISLFVYIRTYLFGRAIFFEPILNVKHQVGVWSLFFLCHIIGDRIMLGGLSIGWELRTAGRFFCFFYLNPFFTIYWTLSLAGCLGLPFLPSLKTPDSLFNRKTLHHIHIELHVTC